MSAFELTMRAANQGMIRRSGSSVLRGSCSSLGRSGRALPGQARWDVWFWRMLRMALGSIWAAGLLLTGLYLFGQLAHSQGHLFGAISNDLPWVRQMAAWLCLAAICAAQFVFMVLVADVLCPGASLFVTGILKAFFGSLLLMAMARCLWIVALLFMGQSI